MQRPRRLQRNGAVLGGAANYDNVGKRPGQSLKGYVHRLVNALRVLQDFSQSDDKGHRLALDTLEQLIGVQVRIIPGHRYSGIVEAGIGPHGTDSVYRHEGKPFRRAVEYRRQVRLDDGVLGLHEVVVVAVDN